MLLFHMEEVPIVELTFYARRLCRIYFLIFCASVVDLAIFKMKAQLFGFSLFCVIMVFVNIVALRFVISNASTFNILATIAIASFMEVIILTTTIVFSIQGFYKPVYFNIYPIVWCIMELSTIYILYGFYRKVADEQVDNEAVDSVGGVYVPSCDVPIEYANTANSLCNEEVSEEVGIELTEITTAIEDLEG